MNRTTDSYTVRHRLTFTPSEVLAGLALLFPDTFRALDEKRTTIQFQDGDIGTAQAEVSWDEVVQPITTQIDSMRGDYENWGPSDADLAHGPAPTPPPNETLRETPPPHEDTCDGFGCQQCNPYAD